VQHDPNNDTIDRPFTVPFVHRLRFTDDVFGGDHRVLADVLEPSEGRSARAQFWVDANVAATNPGLCSNIERFCETHARRFVHEGEVQIVPGGEAVKNDARILEHILGVFDRAGLDRRSYVVALGGGAMLDAVGFAAAIAHRGLRLIRLPTSTLGQGDSGVGVKNGVNLFGKKNWLGSFVVPWAVINDTRLLHSLSDRDFRCGFSECVKVSLLKDAEMFDGLCRVAGRIRHRDMDVALPVIRKSALLHLAHITEGGDPFETLEARPLDFGHWSAHKLETMSGFRLRHGEAVAIGVALDTVYSSLACGLPNEAARRVLQCLADFGFVLDAPDLHKMEVLYRGLEEFRQHLGGKLTLTMLGGIGRAMEVHEVDLDRMGAAIQEVSNFAHSRPDA
jgi:3-dehydroquinate synthase